MLQEELDPSTRAELLRLTPSGDLLDLAREMRDMGVESLLFCAPSGKIQQVVSDRQIAHLAAHPDPVPTAVAEPTAVTGAPIPAGVEPLVGPAPGDPDPVIPPQGTPARVESRAPAVRR